MLMQHNYITIKTKKFTQCIFLIKKNITKLLNGDIHYHGMMNYRLYNAL